MLQIEKKVVVDESQNPVAALIDYDTFERMERVIEDHALGKLMDEVKEEPSLGLDEARSEYYRIAFGAHRVGIRLDKRAGEVEFVRVLPRRDIYRRFP